MIEPGLWSGPWYFDQFPQARKENCVGQRGQAEKDADVIIPSTMPQNDGCDDIHYDEFFPAPPYFAEDDDDDSFHLEPVSPTLGRVLVISDEAQSEIESDFRAERVVSTFESAGYAVEAWKFGGLEIIEELRRGAFNIIIMLGNVDDDSGLFSSLLREWIHKAGGLLFVNGEGNAMEGLFEDVFHASWQMAEYRRYTHYPGNAIGFLPHESSFRKAAPQLISVKACNIYAPPEDQTFSPALVTIMGNPVLWRLLKLEKELRLFSAM
jgi:hypothetical protein